jgi:hypothetical protein
MAMSTTCLPGSLLTRQASKQHNSFQIIPATVCRQPSKRADVPIPVDALLGTKMIARSESRIR